MRFHVLTIFPRMFESPFAEGVVHRGIEAGLVELFVHDIRDFTRDRHRSTDDYTFGGGPGMLMKPEPLFEGVEFIRDEHNVGEEAPIMLLTPQGERLTQHSVETFAVEDDVILICGRYEGFDERVREHLATHEISVGDYVLNGGEAAAIVLVESIARLVPGVLGSNESARSDSFSSGLLQYPQYTRPAEFRGMPVPDILLSGDHARIEKWRRQESLRRTFKRRPDLLERADLSPEDWAFLDSLQQ